MKKMNFRKIKARWNLFKINTEGESKIVYCCFFFGGEVSERSGDYLQLIEVEWKFPKGSGYVRSCAKTVTADVI
jgi:hypothetical protein